MTTTQIATDAATQADNIAQTRVTRGPAQVPVTYNRHGIESTFLDELSRRVLIYDGGMGTQLLDRQHRLTDADYLGNPQRGPHEILGTTRPDILEEIHEAYLAAGADVLETDTFQGSLRRLHEWGLADRAYEINVNAVACARRAADRWSTPERPRFVAVALVQAMYGIYNAPSVQGL